jgi:hypothetical protein
MESHRTDTYRGKEKQQKDPNDLKREVMEVFSQRE